MPRVPPVTRTTAISGASGTRSHASGWPSCTRSPSAASQPITCPANGVRTSETPTRPISSPTSTADEWSEPTSVPGSSPVPGACRDDSGLKMPLDGLTTTRSDM